MLPWMLCKVGQIWLLSSDPDQKRLTYEKLKGFHQKSGSQPES